MKKAAGALVYGNNSIFEGCKGKILGFNRSYRNPDKLWSIPAGHRDDGESGIDAAIREVLEETGWEVKPVLAPPFVKSGLIDTKGEYEVEIYLCYPVRKVGSPSHAFEGEYEWIDPELIKQGLYANVNTEMLEFFQDMFAKHVYWFDDIPGLKKN